MSTTNTQIHIGMRILTQELVVRGLRQGVCSYNSVKKAYCFRLGYEGIINLAEAKYIPEDAVIAAVNGDGDRLQSWLLYFMLDLRRN